VKMIPYNNRVSEYKEAISRYELVGCAAMDSPIIVGIIFEFQES